MKAIYLSQRSFAVILTTMILLVAIPASVVFASASGPNYPSTASGTGWTSASSIGADDANYATYSIASSATSTPLNGSNYGFTIPSGSTIDGITVVISRASSGLASIEDANIQMRKAGVTTGINKAVGTDWPTSQALATYGGATDVWGTTWTADDINNTGFGVTLSAFNHHASQASTASVDYMRITVSYTLPDTTTAVNCVANPITYGGNTTCTATVTRSAGSNTPTGLVSWATDGSGSFATSPCTLAGAGASATCSVTYTPSSIGDGSHLITATYAENTNFSGSNGNQTVTVNKTTPTISVTNSPVTYNGSPQAATVTSSVAGIVSDVRYNGSSTVPTSAGTYAVTADFAPTDTTSYDSLVDASAGNFVIEKAIPTVSVTNSPVTYNGSPQTATVTGSVAGLVSNVQYDGSLTQPTDAGTYVITADFAPTDSANYNNLISDEAGNFVIEKATPTISVTGSPVTYNGSPQAATVTGSVAGVVSDVKYNGSSTVPTDVGTYAITADFAPTDSTNYNSLADASAGNFVIQKAIPNVSVTNSPVTYNGSPQAATVTGSVAGVVSDIKYDGSSTAPTDPGTYAVTADFAPTDTANYNSLADASAGNFVINNETTPPTVSSSVRASTNPTSAVTVDFTVTFSEAVTGVDATDFALTTTGAISGATVDNVGGSGTTYTITVGTGSGDGTIRLDVLDDNTIVDGASNPLAGGFTSGEAYTVDKSSNVDVTIGGNLVGSYNVGSEQSVSDNYGINGGPVLVSSTNGFPIFTSQRAIFGSSFNSIVGYPADQLTTEYWFTSYDDVGMITYLVIGNPDPTLTAEVDVYIGGVKKNVTPYSIAPGQRIFPRYGINAGPVQVVSTNGVNIFTSERTKFGESFNEVMGYPANQLTTDYWFTSYDDTGMITYLVIGNPHATLTAEVDVYIAGNKMNATPYSIAPGQRIFPRYATNAGPVRVVSTNGVDLFTSERTKFGQSFNEVMGYPANQLTTDYWFTSYDDLGMITYLVIGNPDPTLTAQVDVYINGVKKNASPYSIAPGQRVFPRYATNAGPVQVVSTNGVDIFTSERSKYLSSFNEILGLPNDQLTTDYWFTSYDDLGMQTELVISAP